MQVRDEDTSKVQVWRARRRRHVRRQQGVSRAQLRQASAAKNGWGHAARHSQDAGRGCNVDEGGDGQTWYVRRVGVSVHAYAV